MAEILKSLFPKMVDLHNYPARNSFQLKLDNWNTLNRKVLRKINADLDHNTLKSLSQADLKTLERVLYHIMKKSQLALEATLSTKSGSNADMTANSEYCRSLPWKEFFSYHQFFLFSTFMRLVRVADNRPDKYIDKHTMNVLPLTYAPLYIFTRCSSKQQ